MRWAANETGVSPNAHLHPSSGETWGTWLDKLAPLAEAGALLALMAIFVHQAVIWRDHAGRKPWPMVEKAERAAAIIAFVSILAAGTSDAFPLAKVAIVIVWMFAAWNLIPHVQTTLILKGFCALTMLTLMHVPGAGDDLPDAERIAGWAASLHTASVAVWVGSGLAIYAALDRKQELAGAQLHTLLPRFMKWAWAAFGGILLSLLVEGLSGSGLLTSWPPGLTRTLMLLRLLLFLVIAGLATAGYRRWKQAGAGEMRHRYPFQQTIRFCLSLTVFAVLFAMLS